LFTILKSTRCLHHKSNAAYLSKELSLLPITGKLKELLVLLDDKPLALNTKKPFLRRGKEYVNNSRLSLLSFKDFILASG
jgi:hypothetical protein